MVEALSLQKVYESCIDFDPPGWPDFWCDHEIVCYLSAFNEIPQREAQSQNLRCNALSPEFAK